MAILALVALTLTLGCTLSSIGVETVRVGSLRTESTTLEAGDAERVRVDVRMGAGELRIDSGAEDLMDADFTYNVEAWQPEVSYEVTDGEGRLEVRQPNTERISISGNTRNEWALRFGGEIPFDMRIECGAGDHDIDLAGLQVTRFDMQVGAGDASIRLGDTPILEDVEFDLGAGDVDIDLSGTWEQDADVDIQGGVGAIHLRLPDDVGVRVDVTKGVGDTDVNGLTQEGGAWVNPAYGSSDVTLDIRLQAGVGRIELDVVD
ncbi:MAG: toast rack family protein [Anaerolineae bacterium]